MFIAGILESLAFEDILYLDVAVNIVTCCGGFILCQFSQLGTMVSRFLSLTCVVSD